jgi:hypothetical protein
MSHLVDALEHAYRVLGLDEAAGGDDIFRHLVLARIIEPVSKLDSLRVLEEAGVTAASYPTALWPVLASVGYELPRPSRRSRMAPKRSQPGRRPLHIGCYHPGQQNKFTGRVPDGML